MCASYGRRADQSLTRTMRIKYMHFAISSHHIAPHIKLVVSNCNDAIAKKNKLCTRDRKPQNYAIQRSMCNGFRVATWNRRKIKSFIAVLWNSEAKHPQTALTTFTLVVALPAVSSLIRVQMKWADHCFHYFLYSQTHRNWIFVVLFCGGQSKWMSVHWQPIARSLVAHHLFCLLYWLYVRDQYHQTAWDRDYSAISIVTTSLFLSFVLIHSLAYYDANVIFIYELVVRFLRRSFFRICFLRTWFIYWQFCGLKPLSKCVTFFT